MEDSGLVPPSQMLRRGSRERKSSRKSSRKLSISPKRRSQLTELPIELEEKILFEYLPIDDVRQYELVNKEKNKLLYFERMVDSKVKWSEIVKRLDSNDIVGLYMLEAKLKKFDIIVNLFNYIEASLNSNTLPVTTTRQKRFKIERYLSRCLFLYQLVNLSLPYFLMEDKERKHNIPYTTSLILYGDYFPIKELIMNNAAPDEYTFKQYCNKFQIFFSFLTEYYKYGEKDSTSYYNLSKILPQFILADEKGKIDIVKKYIVKYSKFLRRFELDYYDNANLNFLKKIVEENKSYHKWIVSQLLELLGLKR